jgi:hypothetical protein
MQKQKAEIWFRRKNGEAMSQKRKKEGKETILKSGDAVPRPLGFNAFLLSQ